jgi:hypothetical protein
MAASFSLELGDATSPCWLDPGVGCLKNAEGDQLRISDIVGLPIVKFTTYLPKRDMLVSLGDSQMDSDQRRSNLKRRAENDRRSGVDTRSQEEKRIVGERRGGSDRRSGIDRRLKDKAISVK